jgi:hypothetical protein
VLLPGECAGQRPRRRQNSRSPDRANKSCFNFTTVDEALLAELAELTRRAFRRMQDSGAEVHPSPRWSHPAEQP